MADWSSQLLSGAPKLTPGQSLFSLQLAQAAPKKSATLPGGVPQRNPYPSEDAYFRANPHVAGMAAEDNQVILNPYSKLSDKEKQAVAVNEAARVVMRTRPELAPLFSLTPEQQQAFGSYGPPDAVRATIAARILSGDPSAGAATREQQDFAARLRKAMGLQ